MTDVIRSADRIRRQAGRYEGEHRTQGGNYARQGLAQRLRHGLAILESQYPEAFLRIVPAGDGGQSRSIRKPPLYSMLPTVCTLDDTEASTVDHFDCMRR